ncbi:MAG: hypothetical protein M0R80_00850 [Proteobacteria bacterium]|jgi:hypothetical protein|nr:hypothetical protein [Pseudomonadota bacterium]
MISVTLLYVILGFILLTAGVVTLIIIVEHIGGTLGDSSLVPGCLMWAIIILAFIIGAGFALKLIT